MNLSELTFESFGEYCVPVPELKVPRCDTLGVETGTAYDPEEFWGVRKYRIGTAGYTQNIRGGHHFVFRGALADKLDLRLKTSRYVHSVRCNYPVVFPCAKRRRSTNGHSFELVMVDRMLTVAMRQEPELPHLHALFLHDGAMQKAAPFLFEHGVSYERLHPEFYPDQMLSNAAQCYQWIERLDDIRPLRASAFEFSQKFLQLPRNAESHATSWPGVSLEDKLDVVIGHLTSIAKIDFDEGYILLATAIIFGYLTVDPSEPLAPNRRLHLI